MEIGAGTGLYTRKLVERVPHVTAIEPDARMRAVLSSQTEGVEVLEGQAEDLPAADGSYDVVTAQSAWHWVDESRAIPEVAAPCDPGVALASVWNGTDRSVDWMRTLLGRRRSRLDPEDRSQDRPPDAGVAIRSTSLSSTSGSSIPRPSSSPGAGP